MRGPSTFKQSDVVRALKAAASAGVKVQRVEIDKQGRIVMVTGDTKEAALPGNEWDRALSK